MKKLLRSVGGAGDRRLLQATKTEKAEEKAPKAVTGAREVPRQV